MLHEIFEQACFHHPQACAAITSKKEKITYTSLLEESYQLAHYFASQQITSHQVIAIAMPRSVLHLKTTLALSMLGAASLFLDIDQPVARLKAILEDAQPFKIVTIDNICATILNQFVSKESILILDEAITQQQINSHAITPPSFNYDSPKEELLAYICYTSGSTGRPKGVPIKHIGLAYWSALLKKHVNIQANDIILGFASPAFDAHVWEYLMAWSGGASVCCIDKKSRVDLRLFLDFLNENHITHATLIPPLIKAMAEQEGALEQLRQQGLKAIFSTGEACTPELVFHLEQANLQLWNCCGSTEETFGFSIKQITSAMVNEYNIVPIAYPEGDEITIALLDEKKEVVSVGEKGILHIASPYLTPGYLNRPEENNKKFWISPSGQRFFCTDDIFSQVDNVLLFHGRKDIHSLKINGVLVNLNEVTYHLKQHPAIKDAQVVFSKKLSVIIACVIYNKEAIEFNIIDYLRKKVIPQALPHESVIFESFPLTETGKTDIQAIIRTIDGREKQWASHSLIENSFQELAVIVKKYSPSSLELCSSHHTLMELSFDSISLSRLISDINRKFKLQTYPIRISELSFFAAPTLFNLNTLINEHLTCNNSNNKTLLFLLPPISGEGTILYQQTQFIHEIEKNSNFIVHCLAISALPSEHISFENDELTQEFVNTILKLQPEDNYYLAGWSDGGVKAWKVAEKLEQQGKKVQFLGLIDSVCPYFYKEKEALYQQDLFQLIEIICTDITQNYRENLNEIKKDFKNIEDMITYIDTELMQQVKNMNIRKMLSVISYSLRTNRHIDFKPLKASAYIYIASQTQQRLASNDLGWGMITKDYRLFQAKESSHFNVMDNSCFIQEITKNIDSCFTSSVSNNYDCLLP